MPRQYAGRREARRRTKGRGSCRASEGHTVPQRHLLPRPARPRACGGTHDTTRLRDASNMKTGFDKFRRWRRCCVAIACGLLVVLLLVAIMSTSSDFVHIDNRSLRRIVGVICLLCAIMNFITLNAFNNLRCPHCGKFVMSKWLGRDATGRNCVRRIANRLPIRCIHCGKEIATD